MISEFGSHFGRDTHTHALVSLIYSSKIVCILKNEFSGQEMNPEEDMNLMSRPDELNFYLEFLHLLEESNKERVIIKARSFLSLRSIFNVQKTTSVFLLKVLKNNLKLLGQLYLTCIHLSIPNISIKVNPE